MSSENSYDITRLASEHGIELGTEFDYSTNPYADVDTVQEFDSRVGGYNLLDLPDTAPSKYENTELLDPEVDYTNALQVQIADNNLDSVRGQEAEVLAEFAHYQNAALQDDGFKKYLESVEYGANSHIQINPQIVSFVEHKFGADIDDLQNMVAYYQMTPSEIASLERKILGSSKRDQSEVMDSTNGSSHSKPNYQDELVEDSTDESVDVGDMNLLVENLKHAHGLTEEGIQTTLAQAFDYLSQNPHLNEQIDTREKVLDYFGQFVPEKPYTKSPTKTTRTNTQQGVKPYTNQWKQAANQTRTSGQSKQQVRGGKEQMIPASRIRNMSEKEYAANQDKIMRLYELGLVDMSK
jgi:hypothetical protein